MADIIEIQQDTANHIVTDINFSFEQIINELESIAKLNGIKSMQEEQLDSILSVMNVTQFFDYYFVLDPNGTWVSYPSNPSLVGSSIPSRSMGWVNSTIENNQTIFLDVVVTIIDTLVSGFSTPIHNATGHIVGILRGVIVISSENTILKTIETISVGKNGYVYVVSSNGWLIAHPKVALNVSSYELYNYSMYLPVRNLLNGESGGIIEYEFNNETYVASYKLIQATSWGIIVQQPKQDIVSKIQSEMSILSLYFVTVFIISATILALFIQFSLQPLNDLLKQLKADDSKFQPIKRKDEIGELAHEFSELYSQIYNSREELLASEKRYIHLIEESPVSLTLEDFSEVRREFNNLRKKGITELVEFFDKNPESYINLFKKIKILDVNHATINLYQAESKEDLINFLKTDKNHLKERFEVIKQEICSLAKGEHKFQIESVHKTKKGKTIHTKLFIAVVTGYEESLSRVLVSIIDLTKIRKTEENLKLLKSQEELYHTMLGHFIKNDFQEIQFKLDLVKLNKTAIDMETKEVIENILTIISNSNTKINLINEIFQILQDFDEKAKEKMNLNSILEKSIIRLSKELELLKIDIDTESINKVILANKYLERAFTGLMFFIASHNEGKIKIVGQRHKSNYIIEVKDNSNPIPEEVCKILKGNISDKWDSRFDFLGLSVVSVIMQQYRGKLNIIPGEEKGNIYQLIFPNNLFC